MSTSALRRSLAAKSETTKASVAPPKNPLEEFAGLMGVDVSSVERFDGAGGFAPIAGTSRKRVASQTEGSPRHREDEASVHGPGPLFEVTPPADLDRSAAEATPRRLGARALGVLVALGVAGCLGAWALQGAPGLPRTSTMEADVALKAALAQQEAAALRDHATSIPPATLTGEAALVDLSTNEKLPPVPESPKTAPSVAPSPIPSEAQAPAMLAASPAPPVSAPAAPPVTRSVALPGPASEQAIVPVSTIAPRTAPAVSPEPKRVKTAVVRPDESVPPKDDRAPGGASHSPSLSARSTTPAPNEPIPPLVNPSKSVARPSVGAATAGAPKPAKDRHDAPTELSANSVDTEPVGRTEAIAPAAPPPANVSADPGEDGISAKSVLQFVPNLYEKAAGALRGSPPETAVASVNPAPQPTNAAAPASGGGSFSAESVLQFVPNLYEKAAGALRGSPPATQVAKANPAPAATGEGGAYRVRFAAPTTEQAARRESSRLRSKFANELGGRQPTVRQAEVHGRKLYQVGIGGMSKTDAEALCLKLRSSGREAYCSVASD